MKAITVNQLKKLPIGTIVKLVWEDSDTEEGKSNGLMKIRSMFADDITLIDNPVADEEMAMDFKMRGDLFLGRLDKWEYPDSEIQFKLYLHETTNPII